MEEEVDIGDHILKWELEKSITAEDFNIPCTIHVINSYSSKNYKQEG